MLGRDREGVNANLGFCTQAMVRVLVVDCWGTGWYCLVPRQGQGVQQLPAISEELLLLPWGELQLEQALPQAAPASSGLLATDA